MDLNRLFYFVTVAECGSYTKAAERIGLPKSSLSRQVKALEDELQIRLLNRSTRKLSMTKAGEALFKESLPLVTGLQNVQNQIADLRDNVKGSLRVTMAPEIGNTFVSFVLPEFLERHPEISFEFEFSTTNRDLIEDGYDLALRIGKLEDSSYIAKKIGEPSIGLFASPDYILAHGEPKKLDELNDHDHLVMALSKGKLFLEGHSEPFIRKRFRIASNSMTFNLNMCLRGQGIALLPDALAEKAVKEDRLVRILPDICLVRPPIYIVYPSRNHPSKAVKTFIEFLSLEMNKFKGIKKDC